MVDIQDFKSAYENKWCPGCGNFGILTALKQTLVKMDISPQNLLIVSGIGQAGKTPHFLKCNMFHGLHGRAIPTATGAKLANHDLNIIVHSGDGDCYGEGGNHFMHAIRRNIDITLLVHNNKVYGLTKGQASPTSDLGMVTKIQPHGTISDPFNPLLVALALGAGFVARGFSGNPKHLSALMARAMQYKGLSLVDILQPCISFDPVHTHDWYNKRVYEVAPEGKDLEDSAAAMELCQQWGDRIPIGVFYKKDRPSFTDRIPGLKQGPLVQRTYDPAKIAALLPKI